MYVHVCGYIITMSTEWKGWKAVSVQPIYAIPPQGSRHWDYADTNAIDTYTIHMGVLVPFIATNNIRFFTTVSRS